DRHHRCKTISMACAQKRAKFGLIARKKWLDYPSEGAREANGERFGLEPDHGRSSPAGGATLRRIKQFLGQRRQSIGRSSGARLIPRWPRLPRRPSLLRRRAQHWRELHARPPR